ncbi:MAG: hypothetical protein DWI00_15090 [Planctomycetota bacterium]|nr:MAG: hypothetical protein DWI00_15090 [Planctomycetota bacterium]
MTHYFRCNIVLQESGPDHSLHGRQRDARTSNRDVGSDMIKLRHGCIRANDGRTSEFPRISENRPRILPKNTVRPGPKPASARGISRSGDDAIRSVTVFGVAQELEIQLVRRGEIGAILTSWPRKTLRPHLPDGPEFQRS